MECNVDLHLLHGETFGHHSLITTPFGKVPMVYADSTASGQPVKFLENFMLHEVLPQYGNSHTTSSACGAQMTKFYHQSHEIVLKSVNGDEKLDTVLFTGNGCTGATFRIAQLVGLYGPLYKNPKGKIAESEKPVVLIGAMEHHSNILPWRESGATVVEVRHTDIGTVDIAALETQLKLYKSRPLIIGSFSAGSNVTGIMEPLIDELTEMVHKYGGYCFWDYAAVGPHGTIDMNPGGASASNPRAKDAVFVSPHKFLGGPGSPGVLIVKRHMVKSEVPSIPGGGTVFFVSHNHQKYSDVLEEREEAGTPNLLGAVRAGLAFQLKDSVGADVIRKIEIEYTSRALAAWSQNPHIQILGEINTARLPIISFVVRAPNGKLVHHNLVAALLNDIFGLQTRAGCMCAGPYGLLLFGVTETQALELERIFKANVLYKPGFVRVSLGFYWSEKTLQFVIDAVNFIAIHAWKFLPQYVGSMVSGEWAHDSICHADTSRSLFRLQYSEGKLIFRDPRRISKSVDSTSGMNSKMSTFDWPDDESVDYSVLLDQAQSLVAKIPGSIEAKAEGYPIDHNLEGVPASKQGSSSSLLIPSDVHRWFLFPKEAIDMLLAGDYEQKPLPPPIDPYEITRLRGAVTLFPGLESAPSLKQKKKRSLFRFFSQDTIQKP